MMRRTSPRRTSPRPAVRARRGSRRTGITLLELLLALGLTAVVMTIIGMAIHVYLRMLDTHRADVEQSQVARAVLQHIAADIRDAVWYEPLDTSSITDLAADAASSVLPGNPSSAGGANDAGDSTADAGESDRAAAPLAASRQLGNLADAGSEAGLTGQTLDIQNTLAPASVPGVYGNESELQVDCSRLPRVDQYASMSVTPDQSGAPSVPSDVKTVAYFLRTEGAVSGAGTSSAGAFGSDSTATGLVRRELDRAAAADSGQNGDLDASANPGQLLAPEVTYLEFRYFDGSGWYSQWDSQEMGGLPAAIEITIGIDPTVGRDLAALDVADVRQLSAPSQNENLFLYRLVVHLPVAKPLSDSSSTMIDGGFAP